MEFTKMRGYVQGLKEVGLDREERRNFIKAARRKEIIDASMIQLGGIATVIGLYTTQSGNPAVGPLCCISSLVSTGMMIARDPSKRINNFIETTWNAIKSRKDGRDYNGKLEDACYIARSLV